MRWASAVEGTHDAQRAAVDEVRVDHRRPNVLGPEQRLDGADIRPGFEEVRREAVAERVTGRAPVDPCRDDGVAHGLLERGLVEVVAHGAPGRRVRAGARRGEEVLPREARHGGRHLHAKRVREVDLSAPRPELRAVESA